MGLKRIIEDAWDHRDDPDALKPGQGSQYVTAINDVLALLDSGELRIAEKADGAWLTHQWLKQAILLSFKANPNVVMGPDPLRLGGPQDAPGPWFDKVPLKCAGWTSERFAEAGFRSVPGSVIRRGSYIAKGVILMPSFVNIGAYVDKDTMVDTWATIGSCAQIGKKCHISGGAGIGGVLEPLQANPVIIEDECFIGARSEVAEGVIVRKRAVLSMGVFIGKNTPIVDRTDANRIIRGEVPESAVVMMGTHPENGLACPQIVKYRDAQTDAATALNDMLR